MKLVLTIEEMKDPDTLATFKAVSGTVIMTLPKSKVSRKGHQKRINFMTNTTAIPGFDRIVEGIITSALALDKQHAGDKEIVTGDIKVPNRKDSRSKK